MAALGRAEEILLCRRERLCTGTAPGLQLLKTGMPRCGAFSNRQENEPSGMDFDAEKRPDCNIHRNGERSVFERFVEEKLASAISSSNRPE